MWFFSLTMKAILATSTRPFLPTTTIPFQTIRGNILFEDVKFSYPQRPRQPVMRGLQFSAQRGQTVALVGPSGSGKSTIISMLERFYDASAGHVVSFEATGDPLE